MKLYKVLSVLLEYPEKTLVDNLSEIREWVSETDEVTEQEREKLHNHLQHLENQSLLDLQAEYVETFDMTAEHSLHLTHHIFGDDKNRGPALIDLGELYKDYGVEVSSKELPDYLPMILEFATYLDDDKEATVFLSDAKKVFDVLTDNLQDATSRYADLLSIIAERASLTRIQAA